MKHAADSDARRRVHGWIDRGYRGADVRRMLRLTRARFAARDHADAENRQSLWRRLPLLEWARRLLPEHFSRPPSAMHHWLERQLQTFASRRGCKLNVIGPRGSAKSTVATLAYVLRAAVECREPYIWIVSDTRAQARAHLDNVRAELEGNSRLAAAYPRAAGIGPTWRREAIVLGSGAAIEAFGTGQRLRGRRRRAFRPTLIVCDDLQNDSHIASAVARLRSREWFHGTLLKAGTPRTNIVNLATALHREALALELDRTPGWISRVFASIVCWPRAMPLWETWQALYADVTHPGSRERAGEFYRRHRAAMDADAVVLWPEVEDLYTLMCMRAESGPTAFLREKQGIPAQADACEWPEEYFGDHLWFDAWPARLPLRTIAVDPSKGRDARQGDYSAIVMAGLDSAGVIHVEADLARRPTSQLVADVVGWQARFRADALGVETNQYQELLCGELQAELCRQGLAHVAPWAIENQVNKRVRIRRLGPLLAARRLRFRSGSAGTRMLVNQLRDFPAGDYDDGPDALEMAVRLAGELNAREPGDALGSRLTLDS